MAAVAAAAAAAALAATTVIGEALHANCFRGSGERAGASEGERVRNAGRGRSFIGAIVIWIELFVCSSLEETTAAGPEWLRQTALWSAGGNEQAKGAPLGSAAKLVTLQLLQWKLTFALISGGKRRRRRRRRSRESGWAEQIGLHNSQGRPCQNRQALWACAARKGKKNGSPRMGQRPSI